MFLNLIKMYITALNSDNLPDINTSWKIVIDSQLKSAYDTGLDYYTNQMNNLDYKNYYTSDKLYKKHYELREKALSYILDFSNMNIPTNTFMETFQKLERKINDEYINTYIPQWNEVCKTQCEDIYTKLIEVYKNNSELNEIFACLNTIEEVLKFIEQCDTNEKKYEVIYPKIISFFVDFLKKEFNEKKKMNEEKINELQQEVILSQELLEKQKKILEETREAYENQIKEIKEENLENRIDLEAKIDEKNKILQNMKTANENTIEEMKLKIDELNSAIIKYQNQEQEYNYSKDKKRKKKDVVGIDETIIAFKLDAIANRIDSIQNIFFKNEVEKVKNKMLVEMDDKYEQVQKEFKKKLKNAKKNCEKALVMLKESKDTEIEKMKQIIKELNEEIQDYKSQIDSLEYKISLYKEKIINYEKEKKSQTDQNELLRILAGKLNGYVDMLSKNK
jgi:hypothetical protein